MVDNTAAKPPGKTTKTTTTTTKNTDTDNNKRTGDNTNTGTTPVRHKRSMSENLGDAMAEIFTGPVYGPGHKRTLSMEVAAEAFIGGAVVETPDIVTTTTTTTKGRTNLTNGNNNNRAVLERKPSEPIFQPVETVMDFAKLVWDVTAQTTPAPAPHETLLMWIVVMWVALLCLIFFANVIDTDTSILIVGSFTNFNLVFFYGAPLSTIMTVIHEGNSISIHVPTMVTNTLSSSFWMVYGLAIADFFVAAPNGLGTLLGAAQVALYIMYPRGTTTTTSTTMTPDNNKEEEEEDVKGNNGRPTLKKHKRGGSSVRIIEDSTTSVVDLIRDIETPLIPSPSAFVQPAEPTIMENEQLEENPSGGSGGV